MWLIDGEEHPKSKPLREGSKNKEPKEEIGHI